MKGAGVQYLIVIEMVVRMEKECKNTNEEENMKKNVKKVISFILSMLVIISTAVTPAMAAGTKEAPTEVKSVTASGLWTTVLNLEFEDTIWMDNITHVTRRGSSEFGLSNTNKLLRQYQGATGLKTGSTSKAGFCLSATAERNHISLIAVVMACQSAKERVKDCASLLDYGFSLCKVYTDKQPPALSPVSIHNGTQEMLSCKIKHSKIA